METGRAVQTIHQHVKSMVLDSGVKPCCSHCDFHRHVYWELNKAADALANAAIEGIAECLWQTAQLLLLRGSFDGMRRGDIVAAS